MAYKFSVKGHPLAWSVGHILLMLLKLECFCNSFFSLQIYGSNKCKLLFSNMFLSSLYALVMFNCHFNLVYIYIYIFEGNGMKIYVLLSDIGTEKLGFS